MAEKIEGAMPVKRLLCLMLCLCLLAGLCACAGTSGQGDASEDETPEAPAAAQSDTTASSDATALSGEMEPFNRTWAEMQTADFWIGLCQEPQAVRMTAEEIGAYNAALAGSLGIEALTDWSESLSALRLTALLGTYPLSPGSGYYTPAGLITAKEQQQIAENRNSAAIAQSNPVRYGFVTENALLRAYPSDLPLYDSPDAREYDKGVETALKVWEPVLVLHTSTDGQWLLVRAYDYLGWIRTEQVAVCDRARWLELYTALQEDFLIVLAPRLALEGSFSNPGQQNVVLRMGTRLPLAPEGTVADNAISDNCHVVLLPLRNGEGQLETAAARIPMQEEVTVGALAFTSENLLRQAFRLLGCRYGWGGTADGWDCSSICQDVYRTMGLFLPRNSGDQAGLPGALTVEGIDVAQKQALLSAQLPGVMAELPGHQTIYIGTYNGEGYVIHATHGVYDRAGDFYNANSVIVSSVQAYRSNGQTLLENFRSFSVPQANTP